MTPRRQQALAEPTDRVLPHNLDAERSVLGSILAHNDALDTVSEQLRRDDFYRDAHRRIFSSMLRLGELRSPIDFVTLKEDLARSGDLSDVGGPAYLASLADGVPRSTNAAYYAGIVREKAILRGIIDAANVVLTSAYLAEEPAETILEQADRALQGASGRRGGSRMSVLRSTMPALFERLEWRHTHRGELLGIDTGFESINAETLGWQVGDLDIIAARPSIGKTAFILNSLIAAAVTRQTHSAMFSLEMRRMQLEDRILAILAGVDAHRIRSGQLGTEDFKQISAAMEIMRDLPISVDDKAGRTALEVRTICRRLKAEQRLDLVVIDYVQLMPGCSGRRGASRNEEVTDTAHRLKDLADELSAPIVLLSQLTRANEKRDDPRPKLSDLRESGALEQAADVVAFLHRRNHRAGGTTEFILEKQRNGPTGTVNLTFDRDLQRFTDGGDPIPEPPPRARKKAKPEPPPQLPVDAG